MTRLIYDVRVIIVLRNDGTALFTYIYCDGNGEVFVRTEENPLKG